MRYDEGKYYKETDRETEREEKTNKNKSTTDIYHIFIDWAHVTIILNVLLICSFNLVWYSGRFQQGGELWSDHECIDTHTHTGTGTLWLDLQAAKSKWNSKCHRQATAVPNISTKT